MGRSPSFVKGLKKGPWTSEEDAKLVAYIQQHGHGSWRALPSKAGLQRCGKSCRLRWTNYLRPDIKRGKFSLQEEQTIIQLHALLGNRWSAIATHLPKRTDNEIKNYWNTHLKKRLTKMGIDPITHKSTTAANTTLSHMTQWENARLEAEARLVRGTRLVSNFYPRNHCGSATQYSSVSSFPLPQPVCLDVLKAWQGINLCGLGLGLETPNDDQTMSNVNLIENVEIPSSDQDQWKMSESSFEDQNMLQGLIYHHQDHDYLTDETLATNHMVKDASNVNGNNFEDDNNYWSSILDKLGNNNSSSFSSVF